MSFPETESSRMKIDVNSAQDTHLYRHDGNNPNKAPEYLYSSPTSVEGKHPYDSSDSDTGSDALGPEDNALYEMDLRLQGINTDGMESDDSNISDQYTNKSARPRPRPKTATTTRTRTTSTISVDKPLPPSPEKELPKLIVDDDYVNDNDNDNNNNEKYERNQEDQNDVQNMFLANSAKEPSDSYSLQMTPSEISQPNITVTKNKDNNYTELQDDLARQQAGPPPGPIMPSANPRRQPHVNAVDAGDTRIKGVRKTVTPSGRNKPLPGTEKRSSVGTIREGGPKDTSPEGDNVPHTEEDLPKKCYKLNFPVPLKPTSPAELIEGFESIVSKYILVGGMICYFFGRLSIGLFFGFLAIAGCALAYWVVGTESKDGLDWQLEKLDGASTLYETNGESVEWINFILQKVWRSIDPRMFAFVEDILEDTLQSVAPSIIQAVKVTDFDIGTQSPVIQKIRVFPHHPGQPDESIFGEVSFSLTSRAVASSHSRSNVKSTPPGLSLRFKTGIKAPLDVKAELTHISGKLLFKILTSADPPFLSKITFSFTSVPTITTGVMPMSKHLNLMRLPMLKTLVNEGVKLGFADLVDPKSMTLDIQALIGAATRDTTAIGVVKVDIRQAIRDIHAKVGEARDSYATVSLSNQPGRQMASTRVLTNEEDPRWNETLCILVHQDDILADTMIDIKVWDADKVNFDDLWGSVSISVKDVVLGKLDRLGNVTGWCQQEHAVFDGWAPIDGKDMSESRIKLDFKMTFHPKYVVPVENILLDPKQRETNKEDKEEISPDHKSGILSVQITQATDLEIGDPGVTDEDLKHPYNSNTIVNPYAVLYINDLKVYQTHAKLSNPSPYWNAITEQFIKDYDSAYVRISVKHSIDLERDPVLGTYAFSLKDLFGPTIEKYKETERWVPLIKGIGFGKVSMLIRYKPVKLTLPRELRGADVGTLIIERVMFMGLKPPMEAETFKSTKAIVALNVDPSIHKRLRASDLKQLEGSNDGDNDSGTAGQYAWSRKRLYFPLTMRYRTAVYIHCFQGAMSGSKATGRFWLKEVCDNDWQEVLVGLHHYTPEKSKEANRNEDDWPLNGPYGQVKIRMKIVPGFSPVHGNLKSFTKDMIGADPFHNEDFKVKAQQWIREESSENTAAGTERSKSRRMSTATSEALKERQEHIQNEDEAEDEDDNEDYNYDDNDNGSSDDEFVLEGSENEDANYLENMHEGLKNKKLHKFKVMRKLEFGKDYVKQKVDTIREGFNSDDRAGRTMAKEI
ncbi:hypothetical protein PHYBLDRAFT_165522 [Phycomyces blakesleeanus NRRL 1555(-)]|uniref:C2 domain-containing protein n=2 Tax=Phycomyces blakesleeanus TaxID=4837 RepID=A0A162UQA7_PHYB8|nr:hypothetical protein PHYBLDRAFT_165522 [Phycomyces blakesleeanus NRRL 1555(-)]OAD77023.1 hypothetical protein PHYBLDRAFT_165522 [Phycomyces blakesleeanus NRRL 1555(-)]|eukprot:XP_018295063.1 hypothetical protein PHYBLDRAFT_165522 [Phycomyces blakesleeanus NRRL 1555(-)]